MSTQVNAHRLKLLADALWELRYDCSIAAGDYRDAFSKAKERIERGEQLDAFTQRALVDAAMIVKGASR